MKTKQIPIVSLLALIHLAIGANLLHAQGTAFTYQGRLNDGAGPADGNYDFRFRLASDPLANNYVGGNAFTTAVPISNGLFTATLDFADVFNGSNYWLEIAVRTNGGGVYATLSPLQPLTPTPYAIFANTSSNVVSGAVVKSLNSLKDAVTLAAGSNVTITPSDNTLIIASAGTGGSGPWLLNGTNAYYNAGNVGLGTTTPTSKLDIAAAQDALKISGGQPFMTFRDTSAANYRSILQSVGGGLNLLTENYLNGANPSGYLRLDNSGNVGLGTATPTSKLEVRGDVRLGPSGQYRATSGEENLRIIRGVISPTGSIIVGSGFHASNPGTGLYTITFDTPFTGAPAVTATADSQSGTFTFDCFVSTDGVTASSVNFRVLLPGNPSVLLNKPVHFIAIGPR